MKITKQERTWMTECWETSDPGTVTVVEDENVLYMDSHGTNVVQVVFQRKGVPGLFAFTYGQTSEEAFIHENWDQEVYPVLETTKTVKVYERIRPAPDGK